MKLKLLALVCLGLFGCAAQPQVVYRTEYVTPQDSWLLDCVQVPPPDRNQFLVLPVERRLQLLGDLYSQQVANTDACNVRLKTVRDWKAQVAVKQ